jgi:integrase
VATLLQARARRSSRARPEAPVFAIAVGNWISPANIRARLRRAVADDELLNGTSPHTLRRSVGTLIAHQDGLDAARDQLGHSDPSVTFRHYVGRRHLAPDLRETLDQFFGPLPATEPMNSATTG